ncbi:sugar phosphate nucleotidyltransferase, partial [Escherichia coli]|uniref:sugar phosphate nucleotidyltransferase n=1 Tax=Escherichia coli TaxID=562 RepID=UPI00208DC084
MICQKVLPRVPTNNEAVRALVAIARGGSVLQRTIFRFTAYKIVNDKDCKMLLPVIMAGGTGSRLWPMSRELYPKQFLRLYGQRSMLQETVVRLDGI